MHGSIGSLVSLFLFPQSISKMLFQDIFIFTFGEQKVTNDVFIKKFGFPIIPIYNDHIQYHLLYTFDLHY